MFLKNFQDYVQSDMEKFTFISFVWKCFNSEEKVKILYFLPVLLIKL